MYIIPDLWAFLYYYYYYYPPPHHHHHNHITEDLGDKACSVYARYNKYVGNYGVRIYI